ncbi:hypothetical protein [Neobacillus mesonae]|uniref:hypothetical protein n=1 Tax=Neobacillus mesonae TaxID=1193713 RepID=UPI002040DD36|nr:hypothetical protein [Neobacillus mesonae]MCM3567275.1 hypothetical protein [Neobacillus mesonae]
MDCPLIAEATPGVNQAVFLVNVMGACENCIVSCDIAPDTIGASCELSVFRGGYYPPGNPIPVDQGETIINATFTFNECPPPDVPITVTVTVECFDPFGVRTCMDSAQCVISSCVLP